MNITKKQKKAAFRIAKKYIESGEETFICLALTEAYTNCKIDREVYNYLACYIHTQLCNYQDSLEGYVEAVLGISINHNDQRMKQYRLQWLNWLIKNST